MGYQGISGSMIEKEKAEKVLGLKQYYSMTNLYHGPIVEGHYFEGKKEKKVMFFSSISCKFNKGCKVKEE